MATGEAVAVPQLYRALCGLPDGGLVLTHLCAERFSCEHDEAVIILHEKNRWSFGFCGWFGKSR
jgi:hypothetical protein